MRIKEDSIFYLFSKFHPDRYKFSVIIWLSRFTTGISHFPVSVKKLLNILWHAKNDSV